MKVEFNVIYAKGMYDRLSAEEERCAFLGDIKPVSWNGFFDWSILQVGDEVGWFQPCDPEKNWQGEDKAFISGKVTQRSLSFYPREDDRSIGDVLTITIAVNTFE